MHKIYSENFVNGDSFETINFEKLSLFKFQADLLKLQIRIMKNENYVELIFAKETDKEISNIHSDNKKAKNLILEIEEKLRRGEYLINYLFYFNKNQFSQEVSLFKEQEGKSEHLELLAESLKSNHLFEKTKHKNALYSNSFEEIFKKNIVSRPKNFKFTKYARILNGFDKAHANFDFDIVFPLNHPAYGFIFRLFFPCESVNTLPSFFKKRTHLL